jgi:hypothetical protein
MLMRNAIKMVGLVFVLALEACGEGSGGGGGVGAFVGTWRPAGGGIKKECPGTPPTTEAIARDAFWSAGTSSDLTSITSLSPCRVRADVAETAAIGVPDDNCRYAEGDGNSTLALNRYTFVIAPDGGSAVESASGQITRVEGGVAIACTFEESGIYVKIAD